MKPAAPKTISPDILQYKYFNKLSNSSFFLPLPLFHLRLPCGLGHRGGRRGGLGHAGGEAGDSLGVQAIYVTLHVGLLSGGVGAVGTGKGPLPCVSEHVLLQVLVAVASAKHLATDSTRGNPLHHPLHLRTTQPPSVILLHCLPFLPACYQNHHPC